MTEPFLQATSMLSDSGNTDTSKESTSAQAGQSAADGSDARIHDVIIIGSGPAGYTAAIYAARANLTPLVFEGIEYGGLLMQTTEVENFPGFHNGIMGPQLMEEMRAQAERFGADLRGEDVERVELDGEVKKVWVYGEEYRARTIILATGAAPRYLNVPGEQELLGRGVSACATCDGFFFTDKKIAVIGGGDSAMEEADFLTKFGSSVTLIHRRDEFRASKIMADRARANDKIEMIMNAKVIEVIGDNAVTALKLEDTVTGETREIEMDAMFVAIGHDPRTSVFEGQVELQDNGYVKVDEPSTRTSVPGVFAAGDLVDSHYQQAITAAGSGCRAALDAEHYLASL
ncbi:thioredoxin-disulfide reductase [Corynebacterium sp. 4HC-13]|uniref:thioredoxin-disulfide reductase n=1 Tax=Corynebacterium anserum TaxID=2684406 RepID=UPI0016398F56|nr:thioredoxin-disulfide reductase [Corynebacterium anserum]MBC2682507.1 thioredoxin-disulfide reductase [Corynebacterium anserum]